MLILVIGDFFIPERQTDLPLKFKKLLVPGKISTVFATGNPSLQIRKFLETISKTLICTSKLKEKYTKHVVTEFEGWRIGMVDSHTMLDVGDPLEKQILGRQLNVDILITNGTHVFNAYDLNQRFYLDCGSATGAFSIDSNEQIIPSFVLMDLNAVSLTLYIYKLIEGNVKVEKLEYKKPSKEE
jgi:vacuolar protein sorting-associated protein 29